MIKSFIVKLSFYQCIIKMSFMRSPGTPSQKVINNTDHRPHDRKRRVKTQTYQR